MPNIKIDYAHPEMLCETLKSMNIPDGTELEIEEIGGKVSIKPISIAPFKKRLPHHVSAEERRRIYAEIEKDRDLNPLPDDSDLNSEWWIKTIKDARCDSDKDVTFNF